MQRQGAYRPAPIAVNSHRPEREVESYLEDFFNRRQMVGDLNITSPEVFDTMGDLGQGNGGYVTKVMHKPSNQVLARKVIRLEVNAAERNRIMQELEVLKECNSPYIVGYFGACHRSGELNLFMEYMDGRSLDAISTKAGKIREDILGKITVSVIKGLTYLRDNLNIMHRDIKPSNILVNSSGQIKICDFGVSGHLVDSIAQSFVGTRNYMSPERISGKPYTVQSDIWSLGLTLVELALGMYPIPQHDPLRMYEGERSPEASREVIHTIFALMECIVKDPPPTIPGPPIFSTDFKDFVDGCLKVCPNVRHELKSISQHSFIVRSEQAYVDVGDWVCRVWAS